MRSALADPAAATGHAERRGRAPGSLQWLLRAVALLALLFFAYVLYSVIQTLDWAEIRGALRSYDASRIAGGVGIVALTYFVASGYDLISRAHTPHAVPRLTSALIGLSAYTIAANLSALLGNWALRYRLYGQRGLSFRQVTRLTVLSVLTNWSGFVLLGGLFFLFAPPVLPADWHLPQVLPRIAGALLLAGTAAYVLFCYVARDRSWIIRGTQVSPPAMRLVALQLALSSLVWMGMAAVLTHFLPAALGYPQVLATLLLSAMAVLLVRLPAGVGVIELVFIGVLGEQAGASSVVAALLVYRAVFQLLPLLLAALLALGLEWRGRRRATRLSAA